MIFLSHLWTLRTDDSDRGGAIPKYPIKRTQEPVPEIALKSLSLRSPRRRPVRDRHEPGGECDRPNLPRKKNSLFIGHPDAGWRSAVIYSLLITARRYDLDPAAWLGDVLRRIATCTSANLAEFLPWNWKRQAA